MTDHITSVEDMKQDERLYHSLFENMLNGFAYCHMLYEEGKPVDFIYLDVNKAFESLTGLKDVVGKKVSDVIPSIKDTDPQLIETYGRVAKSGKPEQFEVYLAALKMWLFISVYSPKQEHFVVVFDVITERKLTEKRASDLTEILNLTHDSIIVRTMDNVITFWNKGAEQQYGWEAQEIEGKSITHVLLQTIFPLPLDDIKEILLQTDRWEGDLVHSRRDGSQVIVSSRWVLKRDERNSPIEIIEINNDITNRKAHEEQLEHLSTHDVLTGLYNRTFYEAELQRLTTSRRYPVSIIIIDLDDLKHTNDTYGHAAGDKMICKAADILMKAFRAEDMVARTGGDEFALLLPETGTDGLNASIERVQRCLEEANKVNDGFEVKFSVGVAIAESKEKLLGAVKVADSRMYQNKAERKMLASKPSER